MGALLARFWRDPDYFAHIMMSLGRLGMIALGMALESGVVPTGIDGGGRRYGPILVFLSAFVGRVKASGGNGMGRHDPQPEARP